MESRTPIIQKVLSSTKVPPRQISNSNMKYLKHFPKMYIWSLKESYSFMEGSRGLMFWIQLPYKAFLIAYWTIKDTTTKTDKEDYKE